MCTDRARQRQQFLGHFRVEVFDRHVLRNRCALVAAFDIGAEATSLERNAIAEVLRSVASLALGAALAELLRVAALGVIGAADKRPKTTEFEREPSAAATWALPRVCTVGPWRINMRSKQFIERLRAGEYVTGDEPPWKPVSVRSNRL